MYNLYLLKTHILHYFGKKLNLGMHHNFHLNIYLCNFRMVLNYINHIQKLNSQDIHTYHKYYKFQISPCNKHSFYKLGISSGQGARNAKPERGRDSSRKSSLQSRSRFPTNYPSVTPTRSLIAICVWYNRNVKRKFKKEN